MTTKKDIESALMRGADTLRDTIDAANYKDYVVYRRSGRTEQTILRYPSGTPEKISAVHGRRGVLIL